MLSALILSGGHGSRMGRDKGLVELGHVPLVKYVADVVSAMADEVVISVAKGRRESYSDVLGDKFRFVEDHQEGIGPLEGLVRGLDAARGEYVLVSPCDTPFLKKRVCEAIVEAASEKDGAVPKTGREHLEPLHGAYLRKPCAGAFKQALARGGRTPTHAYRTLDIVFLDESAIREIDPELQSFWNINSPEDLERAEGQLARLR